VAWVSGKSDVGGGGCGLVVPGCPGSDRGTGGLGIGAREIKEGDSEGIGSVLCRRRFGTVIGVGCADACLFTGSGTVETGGCSLSCVETDSSLRRGCNSGFKRAVYRSRHCSAESPCATFFYQHLLQSRERGGGEVQ